MNLRDQIRARIEQRGPISFAEYMELALYDPERGFFAGTPVGERGDFVTSPHISPVFASLIAVQVREVWEALGGPPDFTVVDLGAADGTLLSGIVNELTDLPIRPIAVEVGARAREAAADRGFETRPSIEHLEPFAGCVIANELLDNLPFRRLRDRDGKIMEVLIAADGDRLVETEFRSPDEGARRSGEWTSSPAAAALIASLGERLQRGYAFLIDYGFTGPEPAEPVRGYRAHRLVTDVLAFPGESDITGPVDFDSIALAARIAGLQAWGPVTQRAALLALGYGKAIGRIRAHQTQLESAGRWRGAVESFGARGEAAMLVDPAGLGSHKVLALGTEGLPEPRATASM